MEGAGAAVRARIHGLRYGFLFLPEMVALAVGALAPLLIWIDRAGGTEGLGIGFRQNLTLHARCWSRSHAR